MALEATVNRDGIHRIVLEQYQEGVYVYVFKTPQSKWPEEDHLQDDFDMAKLACKDDYGISESDWHAIPDTGIHGPH